MNQFKTRPKNQASNQVTSQVTSQVKFSARDEVRMSLNLSGQKILGADIKCIACPECLLEIKKLKQNLRNHANDFAQMPLPAGDSHSAILIRELVLKLRNQWEPPYKELELCHCRQIATEVVDAAIVGGAHRVAEIAEKTSAGTACGTCRPVTQLLIDYRLGEDET